MSLAVLITMVLAATALRRSHRSRRSLARDLYERRLRRGFADDPSRTG